MSTNIIEQLVSVLDPSRNGSKVYVNVRGRQKDIGIDLGDGKVKDLPTGAEPLPVSIKNAQRPGRPNQFERGIKIHDNSHDIKPGPVIAEGTIVATQYNGILDAYVVGR